MVDVNKSLENNRLDSGGVRGRCGFLLTEFAFIL